MSSGRLLTRALVTGVTAVAVLVGSGMATMGTASAATSGGTTEVAARATTMTAAEKCAVNKYKVKLAKKQLRKARAATVHRKAKVRRAKRQLHRVRVLKTRTCRQAAREAQAANQVNQTQNQYTTLLNNPVINLLPAEVRGPVLDLAGSVLDQLDVFSGLVPGIDAASLTQLTSQLDALNPSGLSGALTSLSSQLQTVGGDPAALQGLLSGLLGGLPGGATLPAGGQLDQLNTVFGSLVAQLGAVDPTGQAGQLTGVIATVQSLTTQLQGSSAGLTTLFGALSTLNGGVVPANPTEITNLLGGILDAGGAGSLIPADLPFAVPGDQAGLVVLYDVVTSVSGLLGGGFATPYYGDVLSSLGVGGLLTTLVLTVLGLL